MWLGSVGFGFVADRLGRRSIFTVSLVWYSLATAVMAFQHGAVAIDLWRFIAAIGVGLEQVTIDTLLPELVPPPTRGRVFAVNQGIEFAVVPVVALLGWLLVPLHPFGLEGWRWVALIGASGALGAWWFRLGVPESPRWLALHGLRGRSGKDPARAGGAGGTRSWPCLAACRTSQREAAEEKGRFGELFRPPYAKRTLVMSVFNAMQTIAFYGFGSWVPSLLIAKGIHVTASLQYAFIIALANPVGPLLAFAIADRIERKWQIVAAGVMTGIGILLFALQDDAALVILFGVAGDLGQQLAVLHLPRLPGGAVSHPHPCPRGGLRLFLEPRVRGAGGIADRLLPAPGWRHGGGVVHRRGHDDDGAGDRIVRTAAP